VESHFICRGRLLRNEINKPIHNVIDEETLCQKEFLLLVAAVLLPTI
jgi:hypothetical protein